MEKTTLKVEGMSCNHCIIAIEGSVGKLDGVSHTKVNLKEGIVEVEYDSSKVNLDEIKETIDDQGYDVK
ncbi:MAG: copper chaperone CopZ [Bacillota bacterium]|jgi:copper chaperone|uniref:copper chaperone CopZ n=1 Tax=Fictibacillus TaxID=1329200 RepID=UPI0018CF1BC3|nr:MULTISPECIES: copper chaperone CopZ [unclassified Fictibacillus]MBH0157207.1 copper chaperone CopZ [Fictibacillus sp. 5RED26]MBH0159528.1 copper chaperone CopZ [Fictibacillus sp. 26RED30]MBH0163673.1 copper chaperone CopZ [Fictibacillus sp. 7GRE50]MBH0169701.1 copper chaperone CopZ [Fictibacillus sp. 18YEL24]MBH0174201.1 copper chaperone CopZ [Fictibacillus sp. 23RED33]